MGLSKTPLTTVGINPRATGKRGCRYQQPLSFCFVFCFLLFRFVSFPSASGYQRGLSQSTAAATFVVTQSLHYTGLDHGSFPPCCPVFFFSNLLFFVVGFFSPFPVTR